MIRHQHLALTRPSRIIVLGATGFVGRALVEEFARLRIECVPVSSQDIDLCRMESPDMLRSLLRREDVLMMVSAVTPDKGKDAGTLIRNLAMGQHVSAVLETLACAHAVYISSDAVYDDAANPVREDSSCSPSTFHGLMHLTRERMLTHAVQKSRIPLCIVRPCAIYGAGDTHQSYGPNRFVQTALADRLITLFGNGEEQRDHLYIQDLARLVGLIVQHRSEGILNAASGQSISFGDVAHLVAELCGKPIRIEPTPRQQSITHRHMSLAVMRKAFPMFRPTLLRAGLAETLSVLSGEQQLVRL